MEEGSLDWFRWFYAGRINRPGEMEERWHEDLVIHQSPDFPDTQGTFTGYEGLSAMNRELQESLEYVTWEPVAVESLGGDRYLVTVKATGKGRGSGIELEGDIGHIVTLREGKAERLDAFMRVDAARVAAGLDD
jgi:ketosteroid isomerase-like protein